MAIALDAPHPGLVRVTLRHGPDETAVETALGGLVEFEVGHLELHPSGASLAWLDLIVERPRSAVAIRDVVVL